MGGVLGWAARGKAIKKLKDGDANKLSPAAAVANEVKDQKPPVQKIANTARDARKKMIEEIEDV
jgi:hypothetical protein